MHCLIYGTSDLLTPIHAARLVYTYFKHRKDLDEVLESNGRVVNRHSFLKLLALGLFDAVITLPLAIINLVQGLLQTKADGFWPGWNVAHADLSAIPTVTSQEWHSSGAWTIFTIRFDQWINPIFAVVFFLLFGLTKQKRAWYKGLFWMSIKPFGVKPCIHPIDSTIVFVPGPMSNDQPQIDNTVTWTASV